MQGTFRRGWFRGAPVGVFTGAQARAPGYRVSDMSSDGGSVERAYSMKRCAAEPSTWSGVAKKAVSYTSAGSNGLKAMARFGRMSRGKMLTSATPAPATTRAMAEAAVDVSTTMLGRTPAFVETG